jgi:hypothetical protein
VRAVLEKYIEVMFKKPYEDGFQSLRNYKNGKFGKLNNYVTFEYKISCLDFLGGHFVNLTLFWPKNSDKVQNGLDQKGDILEKNVIGDFFLRLVVQSTKNINFEILDQG